MENGRRAWLNGDRGQQFARGLPLRWRWARAISRRRAWLFPPAPPSTARARESVTGPPGSSRNVIETRPKNSTEAANSAARRPPGIANHGRGMSLVSQGLAVAAGLCIPLGLFPESGLLIALPFGEGRNCLLRHESDSRRRAPWRRSAHTRTSSHRTGATTTAPCADGIRRRDCFSEPRPRKGRIASQRWRHDGTWIHRRGARI